MDVMMTLSTADVQRLRSGFTKGLSLDRFVKLLKSHLQIRKANELEFVVGVIKLFHTIDINGDGKVEWDEFSAYITDAGLAEADNLVESDVVHRRFLHSKRYTQWSLPRKDPHTPHLQVQSSIAQLLLINELQSIAYFEHGSDVVMLYSLHFHHNEAPHYIARLRQHTSFHEHAVLAIEYISSSRQLAISSVRSSGWISIWGLDPIHHPTLVCRVQVPGNSSISQFEWIPTLQQLACFAIILPTAECVYNQAISRSCSGKNNTKQTMASTGQYVLFDAETRTFQLPSECPEDRYKGVHSMITIRCGSHTRVVLGRKDGILTILRADTGEVMQSLEAHPQGVRCLAYSMQEQRLASVGYFSGTDQSTLSITIWKQTSSGKDRDTLKCETTIKQHLLPVQYISFVECAQHFVSIDVASVARVFSTHSWRLLQTVDLGLYDGPLYHSVSRASITNIHACVVPSTSTMDAVMVAMKGPQVVFFDLCVLNVREEVFFTSYLTPLDLIVVATNSKIITWKGETGEQCKVFKWNTITHTEGISITAVCVDDRQRKVIVGDDIGAIRVLNAFNGNVMKHLDPFERGEAVVYLSYVRNSKQVLALSSDSRLYILNENDQDGYYEPAGSTTPQSVAIQRVRLGNSPDTEYEQLKAVADLKLRKLAVTMSGKQNVSFLQLWDDNVTHPQGSYLVPQGCELHCLSFYGDGGVLLGGTSRGRVLAWIPSADLARYRCNVALTVPTDPGLPTPCILHVQTLASTPAKVFKTDVERSLEGDDISFEPHLSSKEDHRVVAGGDDYGWITVWYMPHDIRTTQRDQDYLRLGTFDSTRSGPAHSDRRPEVELGNDFLSALYNAARPVPDEVMQIVPTVRWKAHTDRVSCLTLVHDPRVLLSSSIDGKLKVWTLGGELCGILDHFATRRQPELTPWNFPLDLVSRKEREETEAQKCLDRVNGRLALQKRESVLQRKLSLDDGELGICSNASEATTKILYRRRANERFGPNRAVRRSVIKKAARNFILRQASSTPTPTAMEEQWPQEEPSLHEILSDIGKMTLPSSASETKLPKPRTPLEPATSNQRKAKDEPILKRRSTLASLPRVVQATPPDTTNAASVDELKEFYISKEGITVRPRTESTGRMLNLNVRPRTEGSHKPDTRLNYHLRLAHAWTYLQN